MTIPPWLDWLNNAPVAQIEAALRAELGERADGSKVVRRCMVAIYERRAHFQPFATFGDFATAPNIGTKSRRLMAIVLGRHGYEAPCTRCPLHCPTHERFTP